MKKFLKDLENELRKLKVNEKDISEIMTDHEEMIATAQKEGINDDELEKKFGNPHKLAEALVEDIKIISKEEATMLEESISFSDEKMEGFTLVKEFTIIKDDISMNINLIFEDVIITSYEGETIQIYEKKVKKLADYKIEFKNGKLVLEVRNSKKISGHFSKSSVAFIVLLPKQCTINEGFIKTISGDSTFNEIKGHKFTCKSTSGDMRISNISFEAIKISTVSGNVEIAILNAKECDISLISGDIDMGNVHTKGIMHLSTVSGDVELNNVECEEVVFKTVSGSLDGKEFYPNKLSVNSVNGDVDIINKDTTREIILTNKKTLNGEINIS